MQTALAPEKNEPSWDTIVQAPVLKPIPELPDWLYWRTSVPGTHTGANPTVKRSDKGCSS
jgi:hypothetical protein